MSYALEEYAMIGDTHTAALVHRSGSMDWLCLPSFDSDACFASLLGRPEHGQWTLGPTDHITAIDRRYHDDSLVLETTFECSGGAVTVVDCMPIHDNTNNVVRQVRGVRGSVNLRSEFRPRFAYGSSHPWFRRQGRRLEAIAGPDHLVLDSDVEFEFDEIEYPVVEFRVGAGDVVDFCLTYGDASVVPEVDSNSEIERTIQWWRDWVAVGTYSGEYREAVVRSLIVLKALTFAPTGGIVAAPTASLPEQLGGVRNWDYRFCWIRDATLSLLALLQAGYVSEARAWREWLLRATAGRPEQMQILYGIDGRRRLTEVELPWLPGYADSSPVRIGNKAAEQFQLDVYGELMDALHQARVQKIPPDPEAWRVQRVLMDFLEGNWCEPDHGIWEVRGPRQHFTHSKIMAWVAADRAVKATESFSLDGPTAVWKQLRQDIFEDVCANGYDADRRTFTQYYGSAGTDASLLHIPHVGFLPADDERMIGTTEAIERELYNDGFLQRYATSHDSEGVDGLPPGEGAFLACTFWLADNYVLRGETTHGRTIFRRLLDLRNDVGLLAEEYDVRARRLVGNFPQALSHIPLIDTAFNLAANGGSPHERARTG